VTTPGDVIVPTTVNSPGGERGDKAIDNSAATKYLNFDKINRLHGHTGERVERRDRTPSHVGE
jgi:hypothetical protein